MHISLCALRVPYSKSEYPFESKESVRIRVLWQAKSLSNILSNKTHKTTEN